MFIVISQVLGKAYNSRMRCLLPLSLIFKKLTKPADDVYCHISSAESGKQQQKKDVYCHIYLLNVLSI